MSAKKCNCKNPEIIYYGYGIDENGKPISLNYCLSCGGES